MIWREKRLLLIILGILLAANTIFFFTYRVQYQNRLRELDSRLDEVKGQLQSAHGSRVAAEQQLAGYRKTQRDVRRVYEVSWSTENRRLIAVISEVKNLAAKAGLVPKAIGLTRSVTKAASAKEQVPAGATEVGIGFAVEGKYDQVRRLINLLELSDQFLIIDHIGLSSVNGDMVSINVHLKTLFRDAPAGPRTANQEL